MVENSALVQIMLNCIVRCYRLYKNLLDTLPQTKVLTHWTIKTLSLLVSDLLLLIQCQPQKLQTFQDESSCSISEPAGTCQRDGLFCGDYHLSCRLLSFSRRILLREQLAMWSDSGWQWLLHWKYLRLTWLPWHPIRGQANGEDERKGRGCQTWAEGGAALNVQSALTEANSPLKSTIGFNPFSVRIYIFKHRYLSYIIGLVILSVQLYLCVKRNIEGDINKLSSLVAHSHPPPYSYPLLSWLVGRYLRGNIYWGTIFSPLKVSLCRLPPSFHKHSAALRIFIARTATGLEFPWNKIQCYTHDCMWL